MSEDRNKIDPQIELLSEELQEVLGSVPPWILRRGIVLVSIVIIVILIGSAIFNYPDIISTTMTLTGSTPASAILARTSGKMQELNVMDKQMVNEGDYLAIIENAVSTDDVQTLKQYIEYLNQGIDSEIILPSKKMSLGTMQTLYSNFYITLYDYHELERGKYYPQKIGLIHEKLQQYESYHKIIIGQKVIINEQYQLSRNQYQRDSLLNKKGVISSEAFEITRSQYLQGYLALENISSTIKNTEMQITQMKESLLDTEYQFEERKNQLKVQLKTYLAQLSSEIQIWELNYALITPIRGQVTFTDYWVKNQNVVAGETVFTIIPDREVKLVGKAQMAVERSGKVKPGQKVNIRFYSFPENEYGIIRGVVKNVSLVPTKKNVGEAYYTVEIELPEGLITNYKKTLPYLPEMQAQADIITEDISLIERFFMPLRKIWTERVIK